MGADMTGCQTNKGANASQAEDIFLKRGVQQDADGFYRHLMRRICFSELPDAALVTLSPQFQRIFAHRKVWRMVYNCAHDKARVPVDEQNQENPFLLEVNCATDKTPLADAISAALYDEGAKGFADFATCPHEQCNAEAIGRFAKFESLPEVLPIHVSYLRQRGDQVRTHFGIKALVPEKLDLSRVCDNDADQLRSIYTLQAAVLYRGQNNRGGTTSGHYINYIRRGGDTGFMRLDDNVDALSPNERVRRAGAQKVDSRSLGSLPAEEDFQPFIMFYIRDRPPHPQPVPQSEGEKNDHEADAAARKAAADAAAKAAAAAAASAAAEAEAEAARQRVTQARQQRESRGAQAIRTAQDNRRGQAESFDHRVLRATSKPTRHRRATQGASARGQRGCNCKGHNAQALRGGGRHRVPGAGVQGDDHCSGDTDEPGQASGPEGFEEADDTEDQETEDTQLTYVTSLQRHFNTNVAQHWDDYCGPTHKAAATHRALSFKGNDNKTTTGALLNNYEQRLRADMIDLWKKNNQRQRKNDTQDQRNNDTQQQPEGPKDRGTQTVESQDGPPSGIPTGQAGGPPAVTTGGGDDAEEEADAALVQGITRLETLIKQLQAKSCPCPLNGETSLPVEGIRNGSGLPYRALLVTVSYPPADGGAAVSLDPWVMPLAQEIGDVPDPSFYHRLYVFPPAEGSQRRTVRIEISGPVGHDDAPDTLATRDTISKFMNWFEFEVDFALEARNIVVDRIVDDMPTVPLRMARPEPQAPAQPPTGPDGGNGGGGGGGGDGNNGSSNTTGQPQTGPTTATNQPPTVQPPPSVPQTPGPSDGQTTEGQPPQTQVPPPPPGTVSTTTPANRDWVAYVQSLREEGQATTDSSIGQKRKRVDDDGTAPKRLEQEHADPDDDATKLSSEPSWAFNVGTRTLTDLGAQVRDALDNLLATSPEDRQAIQAMQRKLQQVGIGPSSSSVPV
ncbi:hypothetical protein DHEL01_v212071 [Diaporthe helianthi]|uniref:USP domain-containing protein n=1 Tax=Diaporthe helianthi TaxID=158607 RepID=A0A2P5HH14_DIAHE|nr:hypothetical protein DHEL01_v212071 [Diaporthe helianthi]